MILKEKTKMGENLKYSVIVRPLTDEEGGGYLAYYPDIPGCYADGETPEQAAHEAEDALRTWLLTAKEFGEDIPDVKLQYSGQTRLRLPKYLHAELAIRAKYEGVSFNALVTFVLAEFIGHAEHKH
jgi:antitoxin HicB